MFSAFILPYNQKLRHGIYSSPVFVLPLIKGNTPCRRMAHEAHMTARTARLSSRSGRQSVAADLFQGLTSSTAYRNDDEDGESRNSMFSIRCPSTRDSTKKIPK